MVSLNRRQFTRSLLAVPAAAVVGTRLGAFTPAAAAPADFDAQVLVGQANGLLMRRTRAGDGTWDSSWEQLDTTGGTLYRVSAAGLSADTHLVAAHNTGAPSHGVLAGSDGSWTGFTPIPSQSGPTTGAPHVAVTSLGSELHVFGASERGTALFHTVRSSAGSWQERWTTLRSFGTITRVATTRVGTTIDTAVLAGGKLLHAIRSSSGTWTGWGNIETSAGTIANGVLDVALAGIGSQLHVLVVSGSSEVYHAVRRADATWQRFRKVTVLANYRPMAISAANVGGELQVGIIDLAASGQIVRHTIRRSDGSWATVRTVNATGLTAAPGVLALAGTTGS
ncbi:hypothetical protein [Kribbella sp. NPDC051770]|uniref:hypothetical protein n=1 Tax=Kribbella sp. NPDC051770 TaxID=3155413 RepID=UPI0034184B88